MVMTLEDELAEEEKFVACGVLVVYDRRIESDH
jgi:hypothetical protein